MKKRYVLFLLIFISLTINLLTSILSEEINPFSEHSLDVNGFGQTSVYDEVNDVFYLLTKENQSQESGMRYLYKMYPNNGTAVLLQTIPSSSIAMAIIITSNNTLLFNAGNRIYRSNDGGETINEVFRSIRIWNFAEDTNNNILYASRYENTNHHNKLFRSTDDGLTWKGIFNATAFAVSTDNFDYDADDTHKATQGFNHLHGIYYDNVNNKLILSGGDGDMNPSNSSNYLQFGVMISDVPQPTSENDFSWYSFHWQPTAVIRYKNTIYLGYDGGSSATYGTLAKLSYSPVVLEPVWNHDASNACIFNMGIYNKSGEEFLICGVRYGGWGDEFDYGILITDGEKFSYVNSSYKSNWLTYGSNPYGTILGQENTLFYDALPYPSTPLYISDYKPEDSTDTIKQDDQIPFTNILLILLIALLIIYSLFKAGRRKR